jgi:hypothetical protein
VGVAEADEGGGLVVAVAEVPVQGKGLLEMDDSLGMVAADVVGVAEAVPCVRLPMAVVELLVQTEGPAGSR